MVLIQDPYLRTRTHSSFDGVRASVYENNHAVSLGVLSTEMDRIQFLFSPGALLGVELPNNQEGEP